MNLIPSLRPADLLGGERKKNIFPGDRPAYFYSTGRAALLNGVRLLAGLKPGRRKLLVPAFMCEEALWPLREAGFLIDYYSIDDKFNFSLPEIEAKVDREVLAVMVVHYFGIPAESAELKPRCEERGLSLIEDCAHSFVGCGVGEAGAISFFSIRKFLPVPDGGALVVNDPALFRAAQTLKIEANQHYYGPLLSLARSVKNWLRAVFPSKGVVSPNAATIEELCPRADLRMEKARFRATEGMSGFSRRIMARQDLRAIDAQRLNNYNNLAAALSGLDGLVLPCPVLMEGQAPYVLPVLVEPAKQLKAIKALISSGIGATDWPMLPSDFPPTQRVQAESLARRIVLLPIHQYINMEKVMALCLRAFSEALR
jgi:perosamine synthetase